MGRSCRRHRRRYVYQAGRIEWLAAFKRPDLVSVAELGLVKQPFLAFTALSLVRKSERTTTTTITIPFHGFFFRLFLFSLNPPNHDEKNQITHIRHTKQTQHDIIPLLLLLLIQLNCSMIERMIYYYCAL